MYLDIYNYLFKEEINDPRENEEQEITGLATSILVPMIEDDINRSINRKNLQIVDTRMDLIDVKISGWFKHKITGTLIVDGKKQKVVLEEIKN